MTETPAREALIRYATSTRTVTVDGLDPLLDAAITEAAHAAAGPAPATDRAALVEGPQTVTHNANESTARLHDEILTLRAELAKVRDLLRTENQRGNDAIDREESAETDALEQRQEVRRLGLMVDEYGAGASALTDKLKRIRDMHRETCPLATGAVGVGFSCSTCEVLDAPAAPVLPASIDRAVVLREAADALAALDRRKLGIEADTIKDAWEEGRDEAEDLLRRMADETQPATEAHPPHHRWYVETLDGLADEWAPGMRFTDRTEAVERYQAVSEHHPLWKDGTPVRRRFVRETTSYTVEDTQEFPGCDVEFVGGGQCSKRAGHRTSANQDPHTPTAAPAVVAQPDEEA